MKLFPKLGSKNVTIIGGDGRKWTVPKLGVKHIDTYREILQAANSDSPEPQVRLVAILEGKARLLELAAEVMPESLVKGDMLRFGYDELSELVSYLLYGNDDPADDVDEPEKKTEPPATESTTGS